MVRNLLAAAVAALLVPPLAVRAAAPKEGDAFRLDLRAAAYGGAFDGLGVREDSGGVAIVELAAKPEIRGDGWSVEVPFRMAHRQTFGADLSETKGSVGVEPWWELSRRLRVGLEADVLGANRPGWPDLYQRDPITGALTATDRYSFLAWRAGLRSYARPASRQHLRARYRFASYDYKDDPAFTELDVMHVTPRDRTQHELDVSWRYLRRSWAFALRADYTYRAYTTLLSRVRRTGGTNGDTTPEQKLHLVEPSAELELRRFGDRLRLSFRYGYDVQRDPYQGYYTYGGHHPRVEARFQATDRLEATASYEGWYRTYGPDGSTRLEGTDTRRTDRRTAFGAEVEYGLGGGFSLRGDLEWVSRTTNYRDYVPPPAGTSPFDVDFDYTNLTALAGIAWRL